MTTEIPEGTRPAKGRTVTIIRSGTPYQYLNDALCAGLLQPQTELEVGRLLGEIDALRDENRALRRELDIAKARTREHMSRTLELYEDNFYRQEEPVRRAEYITAFGAALIIFGLAIFGSMVYWAGRYLAL